MPQIVIAVALLVLLAGCGGQAATATPPVPTATATVQPAAASTALASPATPDTSASGTPEATSGSAGAEATRPTHATPASTVPIGFKLYTGRLPFTVAYPATWSIDESHSETGQVYFYAPGAIGPLDNATWVEIGTAGSPTTDNLDESREQFYNDQFHAHPEAALDVLRHARYAGLDFATAGVIFTSTGEDCYATLGVALKGDVQWQFRLNARYSDYQLTTTRYFTPMLNTLTITSSP